MVTKSNVFFLFPSYDPFFSRLGCDTSIPISDGNYEDSKVIIDQIGIPLNYADVDFRFENLGKFANTMVNGVGVYILKTQEEIIVGEIRKTIKKYVHSLIC